MNKPCLHGRALTALLMLFGSAVLAVSGVILFVVPRGRTAHALDWSVLGLTKDNWEDVHIAFAVLFLAAAVVHVWLNRKPLLHYLHERLARGRERLAPCGVTLELLAAAGLSVVLLILAVYDVPPVSFLSDLQHSAKDLWEAGGVGPGRWRGAAGGF